MSELNQHPWPTPRDPESGLKFPEITSSRQTEQTVLRRADYQSVAVYILNVSVSRLFLLSDRWQLPTTEQLERIKLRFSVFAELFSLGAPPRLIVEGISHPILADSPRYTQESGVKWANQCIKRFSMYGLIQPEMASGQACELAIPNDCSVGELFRAKSQIVSTIIERSRVEERKPARYSIEEVNSLVGALALSIDIIITNNKGKEPTQVWPLIQHVVEVGCLLLSVECPSETIVAGLFHHLRDMMPSPEQFGRQLNEIEHKYGRRVVEILKSFSEVFNPAEEPAAEVPDGRIFAHPASAKNVDACPFSLRSDLATLNSASALSHLFQRMIQVELPFGFEVIMEEDALRELWEFGAFHEFFLRDDVPQPFLLLYQDRLRIFINRTRAVSVRTAELSVSHRVLKRLSVEFDSFQADSEEALNRLVHLCDVTYSLSASGSPRRFVEEAMLHPDFGLCSDGVRVQIVELANQMSVDLAKSVKVCSLTAHNFNDRSGAPIATTSHALRLAMGASEAQWVDFKATLISSIVDSVPKDESQIEPLSQQDLTLIRLGLERARDLVIAASPAALPRSRVKTFMHLIEVAFLLTRSRVGADVIVAGVLHDVYELFSDAELAVVRRQIQGDFGPRVDRLVDVVTELRRNKDSACYDFHNIKASVIRRLDQVKVDDPELASDASAILCASKICTLAEGISHFKKFGTTRGWSKGSYTSNFKGMCAMHDLFLRLDTPTRLLELYQMTLEEWVTAGVEWRLERG